MYALKGVNRNSIRKTKAISSTSMFPELDLSFPVACLYIRILFREAVYSREQDIISGFFTSRNIETAKKG